MSRRRAGNAASGRVVRRIRRCCRTLVALATLLAAVGGAIVASPVTGQVSAVEEARIVARNLAGGRVEVGFQQRASDGSWGGTRLPDARVAPATAPVGRWLASSPLPVADGDVRIVARRLAAGRVEVGLQERGVDGSWGDRRLPRLRLVPSTAPAGRWLASSPLSLTSLAGARPLSPHEAAARGLLARELGVDGADFNLVSSESVRWSDTSLGCPEPGYAYAQVITPGHRLVFDLDGTSYEVHTNEDGSLAVICDADR